MQAYENRLLQAALQPYPPNSFLHRRHEDKDDDDEEKGDKDEKENVDKEKESKEESRTRMDKAVGAPPQSKVVSSIPRAPIAAGLTGVGMIWIDISSWQTAGCWVPGGINGKCPYQEPDNTVALQEIIKVSTIGMFFFVLIEAIEGACY